jgi:sulfur transfer complex TusBCD TusB component (DsrH family)
MMLRFEDEVMFALKEIAADHGLRGEPAAARFLVHEALNARGLTRKVLKERYEEHFSGMPKQAKPVDEPEPART